MTVNARAARDFRHKHEAQTFLAISRTRAGQRATHAQILAAARQKLMQWTAGINRAHSRAQFITPEPIAA